MTTFDKFVNDFNNTTATVEFDPTWKNGTGYFDGAVKRAAVAAGTCAKSVCTDTNRRILLVGTDSGTVVIFERYTANTGSAKVIVANTPRALNHIYSGGVVSEATYDTLTAMGK